MESLKIGKLKLKNKLFLAPMVDVTDLPYRLLCRKARAGMAYTEMLYIDAILHENKRTLNLMKTCKEDKPVGLQITGNNEKEFEKLLEVKELKNFDLIDLNCGCPSLKITGNKAGSFLLKNPEKIGRMVRILKKSGKPVSVKIRLGYKKNNVLKVAKIVEEAGADALTVHARLAKDGNDVKADWKWIEKVKKAIKIPVIGNGDVFSKEDAERMLSICDGVMIGRGAIGDPLIFSRMGKYLEEGEKLGEGKEKNYNTNPPARPMGASNLVDNGKKDLKKNLKMFDEYLRLEEKYYGNAVDMSRVKQVGSKFLRGYEGAAAYRLELSRTKSLKEMRELVKRVRKMNVL